MYIDVNNHKTYAYTGGKDFNPSQPTAVLIHGVLCDHSAVSYTHLTLPTILRV